MNHPARNVTQVKLAPSILAADFAKLGEQVTAVELAGADRIHVDVMDGHFVPNISMSVPVVKSLRQVTRLPLEAHLMISNPDAFLDDFAEAGSDSLLVHWEGNNNLSRTVHSIKALGKRVGVVINPATAPLVVDAGANVLVAGSAIFNDREEVAAAIKRLRDSIRRAVNQTPAVKKHQKD